MPTYWCVNFDPDACPVDDRDYVLRHGINEKLWLMHYQYSHGGHTYQGHPKQIRITTTSWKIAGMVNVSDWLVAYMKPSTFYAIGEVVEPVRRARHMNAPVYEDSIHRTVTEHSHLYSQHSQHPRGIVRYTAEAKQPPQLVFYEDFTDPWVLHVTNVHSNKPEHWMYPQRIDVRDWEDYVPSGKVVRGLAKAANPHPHLSPIVEITHTFFKDVKAALKG